MNKLKLNAALKITLGCFLAVCLSLFTSLTTASAPGFLKPNNDETILGSDDALYMVDESVLKLVAQQR